MQWQAFLDHLRHYPALDTKRIEQAFLLAATMHEGQKRKSGEPYFNHPIAVALKLAEIGADTDTVIAALLHDTVEDTELTLEKIKETFGDGVAAIIDGVTKLCSSEIRESPRLDEQVESIRKIFSFLEQDVRIMVIKLIDRLHNMQTIEFLAPNRQKALAKETLDVYVKIADKLCMQDLRDELQALCLGVLKPEEYAELLLLREKNKKTGAAIVATMKAALAKRAPELETATQLHYEAKTWEQLSAQLEEGMTVQTGLSFISIALVCNTVEDCYRVLGALHQDWQREVLSFQDYINAPQLNGYRGLHTTIIMADGARVRCKIRTAEMHAYARMGIVTKCFDAKALGIQDYLPWTKRLTPLTEDTQGSSNDFWLNLQNDILGESIIIHGPGDETVQLPRGSTVLDGAFYLLQEEALHVTSIRMNGKEANFSTPLINAASLEFALARKQTYHRDWLKNVQTGFAMAIIRAAMMSLSEEKKLAIGREILQKVFTERKKGFLEEFDEKKFQERISSMGFANMHDIYIAISDGKIEPEHVFASLFNKFPNQLPVMHSTSVVDYDIEIKSPDAMNKLNLVHGKYGSSLSSIRYRRSSKGKTHVRLIGRFSPEDLVKLRDEIRNAGGSSYSTHDRIFSPIILLVAVIILWALNPVIAKWILLEGTLPVTLTSVRMITFGLCTSTLYMFWRISAGRKIKKIAHQTKLAFLPAVATIVLAIFTYEALLILPPSLHLTIIRSNVIILPIILIAWKKIPWLIIAITLLLFVDGLWQLSHSLPPYLMWGFGFSLLAVAIYAIYTVVVEDTLHTHEIGFRYPALLFSSGVIMAIFGLFLAFTVPWNLIPKLSIALMVGYTVLCVFIPHVCYTIVLNTKKTQNLTDLFYLEPPIAVLAEMLILGIILPFWVYGLMIIILSGIFSVNRWKRNQIRLHN